MVRVQFWLDEDYGIIRRRSTPNCLWHPELWSMGQWRIGSSYVMDAITGGSDDGRRGCPTAEQLTQAEAIEYASAQGVDLLVDNPDAPHAEHGSASFFE